MSINPKVLSLNQTETEEEEDGMFEVEEILCKKKFGANWKYQIKWQGYGLDQTTWEPIKNLYHVIDMVNDFEEKWRNQKEKEVKKPKGLKKTQTQSIKENTIIAADKPLNQENKKALRKLRPNP